MHNVKDKNICGYIFDLKKDLLKCPVKAPEQPCSRKLNRCSYWKASPWVLQSGVNRRGFLHPQQVGTQRKACRLPIPEKYSRNRIIIEPDTLVMKKTGE